MSITALWLVPRASHPRALGAITPAVSHVPPGMEAESRHFMRILTSPMAVSSLDGINHDGFEVIWCLLDEERGP